MQFKSEAEAIEIANDTEYAYLQHLIIDDHSVRRFGLAAYFCTRNASRIHRVSEALESGLVSDLYLHMIQANGHRLE